ncbi:hypothetical protein [Listeria newyorkensis]|uniref:hypothetical protein n=1 Tax=Listeria newyorkensis TaxID=1497681 RepID=UPI00112F8E1A|nr:hypothetical protein [Listeria newyorkensis]
MVFSRWIDKEDKSIDEILVHIMDYESWRSPEIDELSNTVLNYTVSKIYAENQVVDINGENIIYNSLYFEYESISNVRKEWEPKEQRVSRINGNILIYVYMDTVYYIIDRSYSALSLSILRKINNYSGQKNIIEDKFEFDVDLFMWLVYKVKGQPAITNEEEVKITNIIGYRGASADKLAEIKGAGNNVLSLLSSLVFLLENEALNQIEIISVWNKESITLKISEKGWIDINFNTYTGVFILEEPYLNPKIMLTAFLEILPLIINSYNNDVKEQRWTKEIYKHFFTSIAKNVNARIQKKLEGLLEAEMIE